MLKENFQKEMGNNVVCMRPFKYQRQDGGIVDGIGRYVKSTPEYASGVQLGKEIINPPKNNKSSS